MREEAASEARALDDISETMLDLYEDALVDLLNQYTHVDTDPATWELDGLARQLRQIYAIDFDFRGPDVELRLQFRDAKTDRSGC